MTQMMEVYGSTTTSTSTGTSTSTLATGLAQEHPTARVLFFVRKESHPSVPYVSEQLAAEIQEALAAAERGETEDLGSFAQYADEADDED